LSEHYTLGIPQEIAKESGLLPLLLENGIKKAIELHISGSIYKKAIGHSTYRTKYSNVRHFHSIIFETNAQDIDLQDYINDCLAHNFPIDRQVKKIVFLDLNDHIITLTRHGWHNYRASHIDGKSVVNSFTKEDIQKIRKGSVFEKITKSICKIRPKTIRPINYECEWEEMESAET